MKNKECKECPWIIESNNNRTIREHSIKYKKKHNCHMMIKGINDTLWDINDNNICKGIKEIIKDPFNNIIIPSLWIISVVVIGNCI